MQIVLCADSPQSDTLKMYCWDDPTPRTACYNADPAACLFRYSWAVTPMVEEARPSLGISGDTLTLTGNLFDDVTEVLLGAAWGDVPCPLQDKSSTNLTCVIPDMPAGLYKVKRPSWQ